MLCGLIALLIGTKLQKHVTELPPLEIHSDEISFILLCVGIWTVTEGGLVDGSAHAKVTHLGSKWWQVQQHIVGTQVVMNKRKSVAMEVGEHLGHST